MAKISIEVKLNNVANPTRITVNPEIYSDLNLKYIGGVYTANKEYAGLYSIILSNAIAYLQQFLNAIRVDGYQYESTASIYLVFTRLIEQLWELEEKNTPSKIVQLSECLSADEYIMVTIDPDYQLAVAYPASSEGYKPDSMIDLITSTLDALYSDSSLSVNERDDKIIDTFKIVDPEKLRDEIKYIQSNLDKLLNILTKLHAALKREVDI